MTEDVVLYKAVVPASHLHHTVQTSHVGTENVFRMREYVSRHFTVPPCSFRRWLLQFKCQKRTNGASNWADDLRQRAERLNNEVSVIKSYQLLVRTRHRTWRRRRRWRRGTGSNLEKTWTTSWDRDRHRLTRCACSESTTPCWKCWDVDRCSTTRNYVTHTGHRLIMTMMMVKDIANNLFRRGRGLSRPFRPFPSFLPSPATEGQLSLPSLRVGKWVPASAGKAKAGMVHSVSGW